MSELWVLEVNKAGGVEWRRPTVEGTAPSARAWHTATLVTAPATQQQFMVVFGGSADGFSPFSDAHILSLFPAPEEEDRTKKGPQLIFRNQIDASVDELTEKVKITHLAPEGLPEFRLQWVASAAEEECREDEKKWPAPRHAHAAAALWGGQLFVHGE